MQCKRYFGKCYIVYTLNIPPTELMTYTNIPTYCNIGSTQAVYFCII